MRLKPFYFRSSLDLRESLETAQALRAIVSGQPTTFDFSQIRFVGPFGMVYLSTCIEDTVKRLGPGNAFAKGHKNQNYLVHMGFFRAFGLAHGNLPGQATCNSRYVPITDLDALEIRKESAQSGIPIGALLEEKAQQIAAVLSQQVGGDFHDTLAFAIREILRNAVGHSHSLVVRYCAQYWPSLNRVEVAILDHGRGIQSSLSQNPYIESSSDREAINHSLMPGVSGTAFKGSKINRKDIWGNSGYGLCVTSRICRLGGDFFIGSHSSSLRLSSSPQKKEKEYLPFGFDGTALRLTIRPSEAANLQSRLKQFSLEGAKAAAQIRGTVLKASTTSQMLTSDFEKGIN